MLQPIALHPRNPEEYHGVLPPDLHDEVRELARDIRGLRVVHVNATPRGGGVAEILQSLVPLAQGLGLDTRWYALAAPPPFFAVTKQLHNLLQGEEGEFRRRAQHTYLRVNEAIAAAARALPADVWVVHDPQPAALAALGGTGDARTVWHCHIDTSTPNPAAAAFLLPFLQHYHALVFSLRQYAFPGLPQERVNAFPPAIDPLTPKNRPLPRDLARQLLAQLGLDPARPIVTQVSRFDPWKDPFGVVDAVRLARHALPGLQLALVGALAAQDDPEALEVLREVQLYTAEDPDVFLFWDPALIGALEVNAFQSGSDVVLQKSLREGFGLTVSEALWKATPVIGGDCGGIRLQIQDGVNGYLVRTPEECAARMVTLLQNSALREDMGERGRERVRQHFLMPRLLRDYLHLLRRLAAPDLGGRAVQTPGAPAEEAGRSAGSPRSEAA